MTQNEGRKLLESLINHLRQNKPELFEMLSQGAKKGGWTLAEEVIFCVTLARGFLDQAEKDETKRYYYALDLAKKKCVAEAAKAYQETQGEAMSEEKKTALWMQLSDGSLESFEMIYTFLSPSNKKT